MGIAQTMHSLMCFPVICNLQAETLYVWRANICRFGLWGKVASLSANGLLASRKGQGKQLGNQMVFPHTPANWGPG